LLITAAESSEQVQEWIDAQEAAREWIARSEEGTDAGA
jgi:hypothetical protein